MKLRSRLALVVAVVVLVTGYLMVSGFGAGKVYYLTIDELMAGDPPDAETFIRVSGVVAPGSIDWRPAQVELSFAMAEAEGGPGVLPVRYERIKPDLLQDNVPVVVEGRLGEDGVFRAERVLVKCPSKYEAAEDV